MKRIGILGLQGAVQDHFGHIRKCGAEPVIVKTSEELQTIDALILPGGESSVMARFLMEFNLACVIRERIENGLPVWGICAGSILLAKTVDGKKGTLGVMDITVERNAYGRHEASFQTSIVVKGFSKPVEAVFIRAPKIMTAGYGVAVFAEHEGYPVFMRDGKCLATTFHPELTSDSRMHDYFISLI